MVNFIFYYSRKDMSFNFHLQEKLTILRRKEDCDNDRETTATPGYGPLKCITSNKNLCTFSRISIKTDASFRKIRKNIHFSQKEKRKPFRKKKKKIRALKSDSGGLVGGSLHQNPIRTDSTVLYHQKAAV